MIMSGPLVSIVIPVHNGAGYLREAIDSALGQTYPDFEVLVVNDGSTDNGATKAIAGSYGDNIRYFEKPNGGVASALNLGIREMRGEYFSWLSHDDVYMLDKLRTQMRAVAAAEDGNALFFSDWVLADASGRHIRDILLPQKVIAAKPFYAVLLHMINGCTCLLPREVLLRAQGFRDLPTTQDYDLWYRLYRMGVNFIHVPGRVLLSRQHAGQGSIRPEALEEADMFWEKVYKEITPADIANLSDAPGLFWSDLAVRMEIAQFNRAFHYARAQARRGGRFYWMIASLKKTGKRVIKQILVWCGLWQYLRALKKT